jgi:hypothetical protein
LSYPAGMACDARAVLLVTRQMEGTATNVARQRIELHCSLPEGHEGAHRDAPNRQEWQVVQGRPTLLLRDENE